MRTKTAENVAKTDSKNMIHSYAVLEDETTYMFFV